MSGTHFNINISEWYAAKKGWNSINSVTRSYWKKFQKKRGEPMSEEACESMSNSGKQWTVNGEE